MNNLEKAFHWIADILDAKGIPFQIAGGLAARIYGSQRPLNDIDIYIPMDQFSSLRESVESYIVWGPERYNDDIWDIVFTKIVYANQKIELADALTTRIYDRKRKIWIDHKIDFREATFVTLFGRKVSVMPEEQIIEYKSILDRDCDREDISDIRRTG